MREQTREIKRAVKKRHHPTRCDVNRLHIMTESMALVRVRGEPSRSRVASVPPMATDIALWAEIVWYWRIECLVIYLHCPLAHLRCSVVSHAFLIYLICCTHSIATSCVRALHYASFLWSWRSLILTERLNESDKKDGAWEWAEQMNGHRPSTT